MAWAWCCGQRSPPTQAARNSAVVAAIGFLSLGISGCATPADDGDSDPVDASGGGPDVSAGMRDATDDPIDAAPPSLPTPAAPVMTPCPTGWAQDDNGGLILCDPWPGPIEDGCDLGSEPLPGGSSCFSLSGTCPPGGWPTNLPGGAQVIYVDPTANGQKDGTVAHPYQYLATAYDSANDGDIIALSVGTHVASNGGPIALNRPISVTVWGACPTQTVIDVAVTISAGTVQIRDLSLSGTTYGYFNELVNYAINVHGGTVEISNVDIESMEVESGNVAVDNSRLDAAEVIGDGADLTIRHSRVVRLPDGNGARISTVAGIVRIEDSVVGSFDPGTPLAGGCGLYLFASGVIAFGGDLILDRSVIGSDISVMSEESNALVRDSQILYTSGDTTMTRHSVSVTRGASATLERVVINGAITTAALVDASSLTVSDFVVRDSLGNSLGQAGRGIEVRAGATVNASRVVIADNRDLGLYAYGAGTAIALDDLEVRDQRRPGCAEAGTSCGLSGEGAIAVASKDSAIVTVNNFAVRRSAVVGLLVGLGGDILLHTGVIQENPIGAIIQDDTVPISHLNDGVVWLNNTVNVDAASFPLPGNLPEMTCLDTIDNDSDGLSDCLDSDCCGTGKCCDSPVCTSHDACQQ